MRQMVAPPHGACVIEARVQVLFASTIDLAMHPVYTRAPFNDQRHDISGTDYNFTHG